ncbi:21755_t:CDS:2, partial [Cetraspora pellucida]
MPFILRRFLKFQHIKVETSKRWQENFSKRQVVTKLCSLWATEAKALKLAFTTPMTSIICQELQESLNKEHDLLVQSYAEYLGFGCALLNKKLEFYNHITYTFLDNEKESTKLKFHVGDIVELSENSEGITYAKIKLIFKHEANNEQSYAFIQFEKFQKANQFDSILECPFYVQKSEGTR